MERAGLITGSWSVVGGRRRRTYELTDDASATAVGWATLSADSPAADSVRWISPAEAERLAASRPSPRRRRTCGGRPPPACWGSAPIEAIEPADLGAMDVREEGRTW
ncbi:PadR family transcriptional regulator [Nonomuraea zeae]|uniref:PadR family transcriptional regulator n=1 Tax=Nonomuraea zeae TaxID=1642303 RepID=UPI001F106F73|nr:PadR family transcriptional regulator [Nonomuraea zeae]